MENGLIFVCVIVPQAFIVNDVELSPGPKSLLFDKHIEYIANHGKDQNDFVSVQLCVRDLMGNSMVDGHFGMTYLLYTIWNPTGILHDRISSNVWNILGSDCFRFNGRYFEA